MCEAAGEKEIRQQKASSFSASENWTRGTWVSSLPQQVSNHIHGHHLD